MKTSLADLGCERMERLQSALHTQLAVYVFDVMAHRVAGHKQSRCDLFHGEAPPLAVEDLTFPAGQSDSLRVQWHWPSYSKFKSLSHQHTATRFPPLLAVPAYERCSGRNTQGGPAARRRLYLPLPAVAEILGVRNAGRSFQTQRRRLCLVSWPCNTALQPAHRAACERVRDTTQANRWTEPLCGRGFVAL
jgi:hypothetical protein